MQGSGQLKQVYIHLRLHDRALPIIDCLDTTLLYHLPQVILEAVR